MVPFDFTFVLKITMVSFEMTTLLLKTLSTLRMTTFIWLRILVRIYFFLSSCHATDDHLPLDERLHLQTSMRLRYGLFQHFKYQSGFLSFACLLDFRWCYVDWLFCASSSRLDLFTAFDNLRRYVNLIIPHHPFRPDCFSETRWWSRRSKTTSGTRRVILALQIRRHYRVLCSILSGPERLSTYP